MFVSYCVAQLRLCAVCLVLSLANLVASSAEAQSVSYSSVPRLRDPVVAYAELHRPGPRRLWLTALEEAAFLGIGAGWYFLDKGTNIVDWDNPAWDQRFTRHVLRLDNNAFPINFVWHPLSGAAFHAAARANGSSLFGAMAFSAFTSAAWEYLVEFREKVSVNDLIVTPVAGIALGEFASQLGRYLHRTARHPTRVQRTFGWLFGPMEAIHNGRRPSRGLGTPADNLGFSADIWHRFSLQAGYAAGLDWVPRSAHLDSESVRGAELRSELELVAVPSHLHAGSFRRFFHDADVTRLRLRGSLGPAQQQDIDLFAQSTLFGFYQQRMPEPGQGHSWLAGFQLAYRYRRMSFGEFTDDLGLALGGLSLRSWTRTRNCLVDIGLDVGPGMSGIHSFRYDDWANEHTSEVGKSILEKHGYSYGFGGWGQFTLAIESEFVRLTTRLHAGQYDSKQGLDRTQEKVTDDAPTRERLLDLEGIFELMPFRENGFTIALSLLSQLRTSQIDELLGKARLTRAFVLSGWTF
ncbi:MAG: DUF3943 domain-containing protein [Myxococcales bacterium]